MKKSTVAIISVICTIAICVGVFFVTDYFSKRDGRTRESRELILQEEYDADFVIEEYKTEDAIYTAFECLNGRMGVAKFNLEKNKYRWGSTRYADNDVPNVQKVLWEYADIIFFNKPDLDYVELTYKVIDYNAKEIEVTERIEYEKEKQILYAKRPQYEEPIAMTFFDKNGKKYEFVDESEHPNGCYIKK